MEYAAIVISGSHLHVIFTVGKQKVGGSSSVGDITWPSAQDREAKLGPGGKNASRGLLDVPHLGELRVFARLPAIRGFSCRK